MQIIPLCKGVLCASTRHLFNRDKCFEWWSREAFRATGIERGMLIMIGSTFSSLAIEVLRTIYCTSAGVCPCTCVLQSSIVSQLVLWINYILRISPGAMKLHKLPTILISNASNASTPYCFLLPPFSTTSFTTQCLPFFKHELPAGHADTQQSSAHTDLGDLSSEPQGPRPSRRRWYRYRLRAAW